MLTKSKTNVTALNTELNEMTQQGKILEALQEFYAEDCIFQEGNKEPLVGREAQHQNLEAFFGTLKNFNGATLHSAAVNGNVSLNEWTFDMDGPDGPILWNEILRRVWKDGKVVSERFYTAD